MTRRLRPFAALALVTVIGVVTYAASEIGTASAGGTGAGKNKIASLSSAAPLPSKRSSAAPGTLPARGSAGSKGSSAAPGTLPPMGSPLSRGSSAAPGTLPPRGSSR